MKSILYVYPHTVGGIERLWKNFNFIRDSMPNAKVDRKGQKIITDDITFHFMTTHLDKDSYCGVRADICIVYEMVEEKREI